MGVMDLQADLRERWRPSDAQIEAADELLVRLPELDGVFSGHLLVGKELGFWTAEVEVVPIDGIFETWSGCFDALRVAGDEIHARGGRPVVGGYAWHSAPGCWAVFEDLLSVWAGAS